MAHLAGRLSRARRGTPSTARPRRPLAARTRTGTPSAPPPRLPRPRPPRQTRRGRCSEPPLPLTARGVGAVQFSCAHAGQNRVDMTGSSWGPSRFMAVSWPFHGRFMAVSWLRTSPAGFKCRGRVRSPWWKATGRPIVAAALAATRVSLQLQQGLSTGVAAVSHDSPWPAGRRGPFPHAPAG